jgi:hypothetical protein
MVTKEADQKPYVQVPFVREGSLFSHNCSQYLPLNNNRPLSRVITLTIGDRG